MKQFIIAIGLILLCSSSIAKTIYPDVAAQLDHVHDGDTIYVNIINAPEVLGRNLGVRISGVDTPELNGKCAYEKKLALEAKAFVTSLFQPNQYLTLRNVSRDMYFRIDADIYFEDGTRLSDLLIQKGYAHPYDGTTKKQSWCE